MTANHRNQNSTTKLPSVHNIVAVVYLLTEIRQ